MFLAWSRVAIAAAILLPLALRSGALAGCRSAARRSSPTPRCEIVVPFTLISIGEQHVSSSLTAILIATMPLMVALLAAAPHRPRRRSRGYASPAC